MTAAVTRWIEARIQTLLNDMDKFKSTAMIEAYSRRIDRLSDWLLVTRGANQ